MSFAHFVNYLLDRDYRRQHRASVKLARMMIASKSILG
jgi:hypothetical protein